MDATSTLGHYLRCGLLERRPVPISLNWRAVADLGRLPIRNAEFRAQLLTSLLRHPLKDASRPFGPVITQLWPIVSNLAGAQPVLYRRRQSLGSPRDDRLADRRLVVGDAPDVSWRLGERPRQPCLAIRLWRARRSPVSSSNGWAGSPSSVCASRSTAIRMNEEHAHNTANGTVRSRIYRDAGRTFGPGPASGPREVRHDPRVHRPAPDDRGGRLPRHREALVKILSEPKNSLVKQYAKVFSFEDVELEFTPDGLEAVAEQACFAERAPAGCGRSWKKCC